MKSFILALLVVAAGGGFWFWQENQSATVQLGQYVPADTAFYLGGQSTPAVANQLGQLYAQPGTNIELLAQEIEGQGDNQPLNRFAGAVLRALFGSTDNIAQLYQRLGLDFTGQQQLFLDGLVPVMHAKLEEPDRFQRFWSEQALSAGLPLVEAQLQGQAYTSIELTQPGTAQKLQLVVAEREGMAVLSFATAFDSEGELAQRLRIEEPQVNLLSSGKLAAIATKYSFTRDLSFFLDIAAMANALLGVEPSRMSTDIEALFAILQEPKPADSLTQVCREEYARLAGWVPRMVAGYTAVQTAPEVVFNTRSVLEIQSGSVLQQLNLLNGHVPRHVADVDSQLFGFGLGLDMDQLMPVTVQLWNQFTQQTFACTELVQLQQQVASNNPAMLGLLTGMAQGIKGLGLSLYDFEYGNETTPVKSLDMLLSVATENPALLASMAAGAPGGLRIPVDGSTATVELSEIQPGLRAEVGLKGQYLTLATGAKARAAATSIGTDPLSPNSLLEVSLNYPAFSELLASVELGDAQALLQAGDANLCVERARVVEMLRQQPLKAHYSVGFSPQGLDSSARVKLSETATTVEINPVGKFDLFDQTLDCPKGYKIGVEELRADGTGSYRELNESATCETYAYDYLWVQQGRRLNFTITSSRGRDSCAAPWQEYETFTASCQLIPAVSGFDCIYEDDESEGLFGYRPVN